MHVGAAFRLRGQAYACSRSFEIIVPAKCVTIFELKSRCPDCGREFTCTGTASRIHKRDVRRRCPDCYKPGVPVGTLKATKRKGKRKVRRRPICESQAPPAAVSQRKAPRGQAQAAQSVAPATGRVSAIQTPAASVAPAAAESVPPPVAIDVAAIVDAYAKALDFLD
jgi:hypothetical protein